MSAPSSIVEAQVALLLKVVDEHRDERCREILQQAEQGAREIVRRAHRECRERMRAASEQERARSRATLAAAEARHASMRRQRRQVSDRERLDAGWTLLREVLAERWRDPSGRRAWVASVLGEALVFLPKEAWRIEHPGDWAGDELADFAVPIAEHTGGHPSLVACDDVTAGVRVIAGGACLDGTLAALIRDRTHIESELLAALRREDSELSGPGNATAPGDDPGGANPGGARR